MHACFVIVLRLSYHQRILDIVPESFTELVPIKPTPFFKYEQEGAGRGTTNLRIYNGGVIIISMALGETEETMTEARGRPNQA